MFGLGGGKPIVGLDIGSSSIKAVELRRVRGEIQVVNVGMEALASDIVVDSMIVDSGSVASTISKVFSDHGIKSKQVATSVSGHSVIVKKISMAPMPEEELEDAIRNEAPAAYSLRDERREPGLPGALRGATRRRWTCCWWP